METQRNPNEPDRPGAELRRFTAKISPTVEKNREKASARARGGSKN
jgi:hypothetical protein